MSLGSVAGRGRFPGALSLPVAVFATTLIALAALTIPAPAAALDREEYRSLAEPICQTNTEANARILAGVRKMVNDDKLKPAAAKFEKASKELEATRKRLAMLPRPSADKARLSEWLRYVSTEARLFTQVATKLRKGQKGQALRMVGKLNTTAAVANNKVLPFEFTYCRFDPSRFT
jgi:hypothetical protein